MKILDKTVMGPVDHSWLNKERPVEIRPSIPFSLGELHVNPDYRLIPGKDREEIVASLHDTFSSSELAHFKNTVDAALNEYGLFGNVYVSSRLFPRCDQGESKDLVSKTSAMYLVSKQKCKACVYNDGENCLMYQKQLVAKIPYTEQTLNHYRAAILRNKGDIPAAKSIRATLQTAFTVQPLVSQGAPVQDIGALFESQDVVSGVLNDANDIVVAPAITENSSIKNALNYHVKRGAITQSRANTVMASLEGKSQGFVDKTLAFLNTIETNKVESLKPVQTAHYGSVVGEKRQPIEEVKKYATARMNEGFYGKDLTDILAHTYSKTLLEKAATTLKPVLAEQGLMGIYYIDPSAYTSCDEGAAALRGKGAKYLKQMKACAGCDCHVEGLCGKYHKKVVEEVPYINKAAQQREILRRTSTESSVPTDIISYQSIMDQMGLQDELQDISLNNELDLSDQMEIEEGGILIDWDEGKDHV
jgi:hypothetical protein